MFFHVKGHSADLGGSRGRDKAKNLQQVLPWQPRTVFWPGTARFCDLLFLRETDGLLSSPGSGARPAPLTSFE